MADLPPSYQEVVKNPPISRDQTSATPSAPPLEYIAALPNNTEEEPSRPALLNPYAQDSRFKAWDDRATKILVVNRLDMNERFEKAKHEIERHLLWNVIVNHLLTAGYTFARIDVMQYWKYLFSIYKNIIDDLYAGKSIDYTWKYFKPMDNVFKYTTKRAKPTKNADHAAIREVLPSQPMFSIVYNGIESQTEPMTTPHESASGVVTTQPRSTAHGYTPLTPANNSNDDGGCCWCCWFCSRWWKDCRDAIREGCCADNPSAYIARNSNTRSTTTGPWRSDGSAGRTGGYKSRSLNDVYNSTVYSIDELTSGRGKDTHSSNDYDNYCDTNSHRRIINRTDECFDASSSGLGTSNRSDDDDGGFTSYKHRYDIGGGLSSFSCHDTGIGDTNHSNHHSSSGTSHNNHHTGYSSHDTGTSGTSHSNHHTGYNCHDAGDIGTSHSNHHSSSGTSHNNHHASYNSHDAGGSSASHTNHDISTSYSCHDTGGGSTSYSNNDTSTSYSCNDTGGGSTDYGCSDTGTTDYSCDTGGGYD